MRLILVVLILLAILGCRHKTGPLVPAAPNDNDYVDLKAGDTVSVNVPVLKSGGFVGKVETVAESGTTLTVSMPDLIGFQVSQYAIQGKPDGRVRLKFVSATSFSNGQGEVRKKAPALPFSLPSGERFIRLIYDVRSSKADHNMAIAASRDLSKLNAFTNQVRADPKVCEEHGQVFCVWVPQGIAVRAE